MRRKQTSAQDIAAQKRASLKDRTRQSTETVLAKIESGKLVDDCVQDMRKFGKNEFGDVLKWDEPGFEEIIRLVADLRISRKYVSGASQRYKALKNDQLVYTPEGLKRVDSIKLNDYLIDIDGKPTKVIGVHPQPKKEQYLITFKDRTTTVACGEHLWEWYDLDREKSLSRSGNSAPRQLSTTHELLELSKTKPFKDSRYHYAIPTLESPIEYPEQDLFGADPYIIGLLVGDGCYGYGTPSLTGEPSDINFYIQHLDAKDIGSRRSNNRGASCDSLYIKNYIPKLENLGIQGQTKKAKRIPDAIKIGSVEQRFAFLQGLMDADGSACYNNGRKTGAIYVTVVPELAEDVAELARSLCMWARVYPQKVGYQVYIGSDVAPFRLPRKVARYTKPNRRFHKAILSIEVADMAYSTCFTIEHPRALFILKGCHATHNTAVCAQVNAYMSQRAGLRGLWSFPKARTMELLVPKQHRSLLRNYAKVAGVTKITRDMMTSNAQFDVGLGSATFTHVNSGSGEASAGASVVAVTADYVFAEEASQSSHQEILPLYRRVDASRISSRPVTWLGTPGGGGGIEAKIADCTYEFWPHARCPHCEKWVSLHPLGALLRSKTARADDGTLITLWAHEDGTPLDWFHHDPEDPIGSAFVGCVECGKELTDESRIAAKYKCVRTGLFMMEFLNEVVPQVWKDEQLEVGVWVGALARPRKGIAKEIMLEMNPEGIDDWYQQRLGIPSSAMANSIPKEALMNACMRSPFKPSSEEKVIRLLGIDQGRSAWYGAVVEFVYNPNLPPAAMYHSAKRNILALECFPYMATGEFVEKFEVEGGIIDNEPSISAAAAICRATGLKLGDQQARLKDDYQIKMAKDGGEQFECFSLKYKKFFRFIFSMFAGSSVSVRREYLRFASGKVKAPGDIFKHLCRIEWDAENGDVVKAKDGVDDLAFALMFAEAAFCIYTVNPGIISREGYSWDWYFSW